MAKPQPYAVQVTRKGVFVWIGLLFFVMGWMFILGILVGRGMAPVSLDTHALEEELEALKAAIVEQEEEQLTAHGGADKGAADLGFYEALKKPPPQHTARAPA
ncbi:MAG: hypothetical protein KFF50_12390, partial [Desulfatitalea sp.]|nr:hypothetical protein [Desulfatitalea sp.]